MIQNSFLDDQNHQLVQPTRNDQNAPIQQRSWIIQQLLQLKRCITYNPDPELIWEGHKPISSYSEFYEFIESHYQEVKRQSSLKKYYTKIIFQIFIYCLNLLEIILTLIYKEYNKMNETADTFYACFLISLILCGIMHVAALFYTHKFREVMKIGVIDDLHFFIYYLIMGVLSYFKLAPFIYYMNRDQSIRQFSFSEINKYLQLSEDDKFRNPCRLFKKRTKPVNMFRDLIFHNTALLSMMITMTIQTIPQLFIQGLYNTYYQRWDDGFNFMTYIVLLTNLLYYLSEFFFILFMTVYRYMNTALNLYLQKIKLQSIQETKQLLKSDLNYMGFVKSYYFHIDSSAFSPYQKKRCMIQIIFFLMKQKTIKNIEFHNIDLYNEVTLQYLANCFKLIKVESISLLYFNQQSLQLMNRIFQGMPNLIIEKQTPENLNTKWEADNINANALDEQINRIQFIENPKINAGWQVLRQNQISRTQSIQVTQDFKDLITQKNIQSQETDQTIINQAKLTINQITKSLLLDEKIGKLTCFIKLHNYYEDLIKLTQYQKCVQSFISLLNLSFQIVIIVYLTGDYDLFMSALIFLNVINPALQLISFLVFQFQTFRDQEIVRKFVNAFLFGLFNYFNIWESILLIFYKTQNPLLLGIQRDFSSDTYIKFKSYALKFRGTLAVSVFQYPKANIDDTIQEIKKQPFFQAIMWRASVEEALNKIPQFFIFILALTQNDVTALWVLSFLMQLKESIFALKDILELVIKAFFIPALNLSTDSVDQFFQSILYFRSISNSILLEYPKSFQIISKASEEYLTKQCTFKINVKNLDFSYYVGKKKEKMLAQFRYVLALIRTNLEIDQAQKLFYMGPEIKDFIRCLQVSRMQQLKLNFYLDEMNASDFHYINALVQKCPSNLKVLQIQIEATEQKQMELMLKRQSNLKAFSYSFFQKIYNYRNHQQIYQLKLLIIDNQFFKLDKYTFEGLNFEIAGNLDLKNCSTFFANFCSLRFFKLTLINNNTFQEFNFLNNIKSNLENLDVTFEKIIINFQSFQFNNLKKLKMILKNCEFDKGVLYNNLININSDIRKYIYIDMRLCKNKFDKKEKTDLVKRLEMKLFDATILI